MDYILVLLLLSQVATLVSVKPGFQVKIAEDIFAEYDPGIRPATEAQEPINITTTMRLYQLVDMDDTSETVTVTSWLNMHWIDPLLKWNSSQYGGVDSIIVPCTRVWRPDIIVFNGIQEGDQQLRLYESFDAQVSSNGLVGWMIRIMLKTSCSMRLAEFPWDTQVCNVTLGSWLYDTSKVTITADSDHADLRFYRRHGVWDLVRAPIITQSINYPCCEAPFDELTVYYILKRRGLYYCFNILFPSVLLLGITLISFYIPIETGEKVSIPVTMFLSQSFLLFAITEFMPVQSDVIPAIGYILLGIMMLIGMCIVCNIAVCYVYHKFTGPPPPDLLLRLFSMKCQEKNLKCEDFSGMSAPLPEDISTSSSLRVTQVNLSSSGDPGEKFISSGNSRLQIHTNTASKLGATANPSDMWKVIAHKLNRCLLLVTILATVVFFIVLVGMYMKSRRETEKQFRGPN